MGTTKDPEGFRRHTAGRGDVLGVKGGGAKRRGCGLGLGAVLALGLFGAAVWALRAQPEPRAVAAANPAAAQRIRVEAPPELAAPDLERAVALQALEPARVEASRADAFPAAVGAPAALPGKLSMIRLLRGWSDAPLADAQVLWLGRGELQRMREQGLRVTTVSLAPVLTSRGRSAASDVDGLLRVPADGAHLLVEGEGWTRELEVRPLAEGLLDVRVFAPRTLVVDVLDWRGAPVPGFAVRLWRVDAGGTPRTELQSLHTPPASGSIRLDDVDRALLSNLEPPKDGDLPPFWCYVDAGVSVRREPPPVLERTRLRVGLDPHLAPQAWAEIDLSEDPLPHVRLQLPPLGELQVRVAGEQGRPVEWRGRVELDSEVGYGKEIPDHAAELVDGRAVLGNLPYGVRYHARAVREDGSKGGYVLLEAFRPDDPVRELVLPDVVPLPRLRLRPILPEGQALPSAWIDVELEADNDESDAAGAMRWRHTSVRTLRTDTHGYVQIPVSEPMLAAPGVRLVVSLTHAGVALSSEPFTVRRGERWGDVDLGPVPLADRSK